jgi:ADP-dependent NAD(P)H-hydrate dehydratase / NAD(P)H-hydrate epimerase
MKILNNKQVKEADAYTIENEPVSSIDLMERAARAVTRWLTDNFPAETRFRIFAGPGNNGGDGLAIGRLLRKRGTLPISTLPSRKLVIPPIPR